MADTPFKREPAPPGLLYAMADEHARRIDQRDAIVMRQVGDAHRVAEQRVLADLDALTARIEHARVDGTRTSPAWLYQQARYRDLLVTTQAGMAEFGTTAATPITHAQAWAIQQAQQDALASLSASAGLAAGFGHLPANLTASVGFLADGSPLRDLMATFGAQAGAQAAQTLTTGVLLGWGADKMGREFRRTVTGLSRTRAETIARTEIHRVYRATSRDIYRANADVLQGWMWRAHIDKQTCPSCIVMDGTLHPVEATLDGHPRCRCAMIPVAIPIPGLPDPTAGARKGADWLMAQDPATQRAILGPTKAALLRARQIAPQDLVVRVTDPAWGTTRREATVAEARGAAAARGVAQTITKRTATPSGGTRTKTVQERRDEASAIAKVRDARINRVQAAERMFGLNSPQNGGPTSPMV